MIVLVVENAPAGVRGELSRWLIEPRAGVFVGNVSAMVRDKLWEKVTKGVKAGGAIMIHNSISEQGFTARSHGDTSRNIVDVEGLLLVKVPSKDTCKPESA